MKSKHSKDLKYKSNQYQGKNTIFPFSMYINTIRPFKKPSFKKFKDVSSDESMKGYNIRFISPNNSQSVIRPIYKITLPYFASNEVRHIKKTNSKYYISNCARTIREKAGI